MLGKARHQHMLTQLCMSIVIIIRSSREMHDDTITPERAPQVLALPPTLITPAICCFFCTCTAANACADYMRRCNPSLRVLSTGTPSNVPNKHVALRYTPVKACALRTAQYCTPLHAACCPKLTASHSHKLCAAQMSHSKPQTPSQQSSHHTYPNHPAVPSNCKQQQHDTAALRAPSYRKPKQAHSQP
jgi:hypothetical protein